MERLAHVDLRLEVVVIPVSDIDRAKALLMNRNAMTEEQAYARLRKTAMDKSLKLAEVAQRIVDVADLFA